MPETLAYASFALNLLLLPLLKILWDVRAELIRLNGQVSNHKERLERLERMQDTK